MEHVSSKADNRGRFVCAGNDKAAIVTSFADLRPEATAQRRMQAMIESSPYMTAQRRLARSITGAIQKKDNAKTSIGGVPDNTDIPDLPQALVTKLQAAVADASKRQAALNDLYAHLGAIIDNVDNFTYKDTNSYYGLNEVIDPKNPDSKMRISISSAAFAKGAAVVYSTARHELIHSEQMRLVPDDPAQMSDPFFYHDEAKSGGFIGLVQHAMQEIETYSWEIEHAAETGVDNNYVVSRVASLKAYYNDLYTYAMKLGKNQRITFKAYVEKAQSMAEGVLDAKGEKGYKKKITWL
jgi:hypothetical protein